MIEWGLGFVMMRQGPKWAFAKTVLCNEPLKWRFKLNRSVQLEPSGSTESPVRPPVLVVRGRFKP